MFLQSQYSSRQTRTIYYSMFRFQISLIVKSILVTFSSDLHDPPLLPHYDYVRTVAAEKYVARNFTQ